MSSQIALTVPEDPALIGMVREVGRALLSHHSASPDDLESVLGELCANVTRHARSESGCCRVTMEHLGDRVALTVADEGLGFDPQHVAPVGAPRTDDDGMERHGGFGLYLAGMLADRVEFQQSQPHGMTVRAEKRVRSVDTREMADCAG